MGAVRHFTSNPYCVTRLAGTSVRSSTVRNSTNPDWPDTDVAYFIVHNKEQELQVGPWLAMLDGCFWPRLESCCEPFWLDKGNLSV